jgi:ATP-dependent Clp protease ATP-binding subunit ClpA
MFREAFTKDARAVVESAVTHAQATTAGELRPEHLFHALLDDPSFTAARVLVDAGAPLEALRTELTRQRQLYVDGLDADDADALRVIGIDLDEVVRRIDRNLGGRSPRKGRLRFARSSKKALELSLRESVALRSGHIGTEHLLLGLVRVEDRVVRDTLATFGIEREGLRQRVAEAARKAS